jgi:hypothetical protein
MLRLTVKTLPDARRLGACCPLKQNAQLPTKCATSRPHGSVNSTPSVRNQAPLLEPATMMIASYSPV